MMWLFGDVDLHDQIVCAGYCGTYWQQFKWLILSTFGMALIHRGQATGVWVVMLSGGRSDGHHECGKAVTHFTVEIS